MLSSQNAVVWAVLPLTLSLLYHDRTATAHPRVCASLSKVQAFMGEMQRNFDTLGTTPLLLNLMVSEYTRNEAKDSAIQFDGARRAVLTSSRATRRVTVTIRACTWSNCLLLVRVRQYDNVSSPGSRSST